LRELLTWLEASGLGHAMRGAGVWSYGVANLIHILGVATLFGSVLVLDLRLLGAFARAPLAAVAAPTVPLAATGFTIAVLSGSCLIVTNATEYIGNPLLLIKFLGVALGLANALALGFVPAWRDRGVRELGARERRQLAVFGGVSLASWLTAVACGRLIAYW
jgi:hypothetical protein